MRRLAACLLILVGSIQFASAQTDQRRSGFLDMSPATQAMQRDDAQNPAMLWVQGGAQLWSRAPGSTGAIGAANKSCASCHGASSNAAFSPAPVSMQSVAARYPAIDALLGKPVNLSQRINLCRQRHQGLAALPPEHQDLLSLEAWLGYHSRGQAITPAPDPQLKVWQAKGQQLYEQRIGQLNMSCAQCHDQRAGLMLGGSLIPQGHATGYPTYRLEWQGLGSLARRLRGCMTGVRAQPYAAWSDEMTALEVYLASRAMGMVIEAPAVRP
jgi:L-cysteine S-thiosulfotransferase